MDFQPEPRPGFTSRPVLIAIAQVGRDQYPVRGRGRKTELAVGRDEIIVAVTIVARRVGSGSILVCLAETVGRTDLEKQTVIEQPATAGSELRQPARVVLATPGVFARMTQPEPRR